MTEKHLWLIIWLGVAIVLFYTPVRFQRRFVEGMFIPILILSFPLIETATKKIYFCFLPKTASLLLLSFLLLFSSQSTLYIIIYLNLAARQHPQLFYAEEELMTTARWLAQHTPDSTLILAAGQTSNFLPGLSGRRVYSGHWGETLFSRQKDAEIEKFFQQMDDEERKKFLKEKNITLLYWGEREREEWKNFQPETQDYLKKIYDQDNEQIYRFTD